MNEGNAQKTAYPYNKIEVLMLKPLTEKTLK